MVIDRTQICSLDIKYKIKVQLAKIDYFHNKDFKIVLYLPELETSL